LGGLNSYLLPFLRLHTDLREIWLRRGADQDGYVYKPVDHLIQGDYYMDPEKISALLHAVPLPHYYKAKPGDFVTINLPRLPLTRYTEYLRMDRENWGDLNCFVEETPEPQGEGSLLPRHIRGQAVCPGTIHIVLSARDRLSGQQISGVEPLDIVVEVQ
jgi:hypothetical protein